MGAHRAKKNVKIREKRRLKNDRIVAKKREQSADTDAPKPKDD